MNTDKKKKKTFSMLTQQIGPSKIRSCFLLYSNKFSGNIIVQNRFLLGKYAKG